MVKYVLAWVPMLLIAIGNGASAKAGMGGGPPVGGSCALCLPPVAGIASGDKGLFRSSELSLQRERRR
jgi:hypothetical protein